MITFETHINNIQMEGMVSQIFFYLGLSFNFILKTGNFSSFFENKFSKFHKTKTKT